MVQEIQGDVFKTVRERIRKPKTRIRKAGCDYLAYALIDAIVDHYFVILEALGEVTLLYFGKVDGADAVIGKLPGIHKEVRGKTVRLTADPAKVQVFNNGQSLYYR